MTTPKALSQNSYVSVGLLVLLLGAALWVSTTVSGIEKTILPRLSSMEEKITGIASDISVLRAQMSKYLTSGEVQGMINSEMLSHERGVEKRIDNIEARLKVLEDR